MTTKLDPLTYLNFWEEAAAQEFGLSITTETEADKRLLVNALYACRQAAGGFEDLMILQPGTTELFIAKKLLTELP